jgi:hypothetical protein
MIPTEVLRDAGEALRGQRCERKVDAGEALPRRRRSLAVPIDSVDQVASVHRQNGSDTWPIAHPWDSPQ